MEPEPPSHGSALSAPSAPRASDPGVNFGAAFRSLSGLAWPTVVTYLAFAARQFTDTWMVGRLGTDALAGLMPAQQVLLIIQGFGFGMFTALNTCASHAEEKEGLAGSFSYAWQCLWLALFLGVAASGFHWLTEPIFTTLDHDFEVYRNEVIYFGICIFAVLPQFVAVSLSNFFFAIRRPIAPMVVGIGHVLLNFGLNWVLMFGIPGKFAGMGIAGAAWSTLVASIAWAVALLALFLFASGPGTSRDRRASFSLFRMRNLLKLGLPNGAIDLVDVFFWNVALVILIGNFGKEHLAASAVIISLWGLIIVPGNGQGVALQTLVGHFIAAGRERAAHRQLSAGLVLMGIFMGTSGILCFVFRDSIFAFMSSDEAVRTIGVRCMVLFPVIVLLDGTFFGIDSALNGAGDAIWPLTVAFLCHLTVILGLGWAVSLLLPELGSFGIWICILANRGLLAVLFTFRWLSGGWKHLSPIGS